MSSNTNPPAKLSVRASASFFVGTGTAFLRNSGGVSGSCAGCFFGLGPVDIIEDIMETAFWETTLVSLAGFFSSVSDLMSALPLLTMERRT